VFNISYVYELPTVKGASGWINAVVNGWGVQGVTVVQSGEPFSVIDFSGAAGSLYFAGDDFITNPLLPLAPGISPSKAMQGGTDNNFAAASGFPPGTRVPYINPDVVTIPTLNPGQGGVPPCGLSTTGTPNVCDTFETSFGSTGRNVFRAPFQTRFDFSIVKNFKLSERVALKFQADAFNIFNHPNFDAPNTNFAYNPCFSPNPCFVNPSQILAPATQNSPAQLNTNNFGVIQQTVGSNRFLQLAMHLSF
jgi:hypothetical protein